MGYEFKVYDCGGGLPLKKKKALSEEEVAREVERITATVKDFAAYPWDQCIQDQLDAGHDEESANKICGFIKARNQ